MRALAPRDRLLLSLRAQGFSYREIGIAAGIRERSVGRLLARAVDRWRRRVSRSSRASGTVRASRSSLAAPIRWDWSVTPGSPGEAIAMHTHPLPGLVVTITAGEIEVTTDGKSVTHPVKSNDVSWRAGAVTHSIKNVGKTRFEAVDIELK